MSFIKPEYPCSEENSIIIGIAMEVHRILGKGFLEIVYKDAMEYELRKRSLFYEREKEYTVNYKDIILPHKFYADFVIFDKVIVEVKCQKGIAEEQYAQLINYLAVSKRKVGLLLNFGDVSLQFKRLVL